MLFVIGASGAGKTAAVHALEQQQLSGVGCYHFDSIGVPSAQVMEQEWGGGERWQEHTTTCWIERLASNPDRVKDRLALRLSSHRLSALACAVLALCCWIASPPFGVLAWQGLEHSRN
jgi:adenylate kinase family enzyme